MTDAGATESGATSGREGAGSATAAAAPSAELLDDRYGRGRQRGIDKRFGWIAGGALVVAGLAFVFFGGWHETSDLEFKVLHYEVIDDRNVFVDVQVTAPSDAHVVCAFEALSPSYATVGWKLVELPPGGDRTRRFDTSLVTTAPATTGTLRECWTLTA